MNNKYLVIGTTAKHKKAFLRLPDKEILGNKAKNFLINDYEYIKKLLRSKDYEECVVIADTEQKQNSDLYSYLLNLNINNRIVDYKPNDLTMEAADLQILNFFKGDLKEKAIGIYGTGNISFKIALRLSERNVHVYLFGRNYNKLKLYVQALKEITFNFNYIHYGNDKITLDGFISFVSAEEVINDSYLKLLKPNSLCLDGGIGNFTKSFIKLALQEGHEVRRLDVRQSQEIMDGYLRSRLDSKFDNIIGRDVIYNESIVAGGIIGRKGEIIVDRIKKPSQVIGIADGIGGIIDGTKLNNEQKKKINKINKIFE